MRRAQLAILLSFNFSVALPAQQLTADAGAARLQQTGIPTSNALTGGLTFDAPGDRTWFRATALVAVAGSDRATGQALVAGTLLGPGSTGARWELSGSASSFVESNDASAASANVLAGARFDRGPTGVAIGIGTGAVGIRDTWSGMLLGQGDAWWRSTRTQAGLSMSVVHVPSAEERVFISSAPSSSPIQRNVSYVDASLVLRYDDARVSLSAAGGVRSMFAAAGSGGGSAEAAFWLTDRSAIVLSAGRSLDDVLRGVPRATYAGIGIRLAARPRTVASEDRSLVRIVAADAGRRRIEIRGMDASQLELMGDFTDWQPVALVRIGDTWQVELPIAPGLHRVAIRADGGAWTALPGLPHADDGLGGTVGLITVP